MLIIFSHRFPAYRDVSVTKVTPVQKKNGIKNVRTSFTYRFNTNKVAVCPSKSYSGYFDFIESVSPYTDKKANMPTQCTMHRAIIIAVSCEKGAKLTAIFRILALLEKQ